MAPRTQRKQREHEARRQEMLAAAGLFSKNGFFKISMAGVAAAAQFAMDVLYRFFTGKEETYVSIVEASLEFE